MYFGPNEIVGIIACVFGIPFAIYCNRDGYKLFTKVLLILLFGILVITAVSITTASEKMTSGTITEKYYDTNGVHIQIDNGDTVYWISKSSNVDFKKGDIVEIQSVCYSFHDKDTCHIIKIREI